ncbi:GGDEF domain-containing protein [Rhizobium sp. HT1-10]|uniref:GGDEF domain-containing protein n=1 Tax=Rhizobium sp. HT1-10 TaxID=3111638 RepID=UPI003C243DA0
MLDYNSLLVALGISSICLVMTLLGSWMTRRKESFLLTCTIGLSFVIGGIFTYSAYVERPTMAPAIAAFILFSIGFSIIWVAGYQFRKHRFSRLRFIVGSVFGIGVTVPTMMIGYDGLAYIFNNLAIALVLFATAREYWRSRAEAPAALNGLTALYSLTAVSFVFCAVALISKGSLVLGKAPDGWAEDLNLATSIAGMTGVGALSLALHQSREAAIHRAEAMTDPLTGLMNRRAMFAIYGNRVFTPVMAAVIFDIDRFKAVNDDHGHAAGDGMLKLFAQELTANLRSADVVARLGGEEFALILDNVMPGRAEQIADRIRESFASRELAFEGKVLTCTVSAGIAFGSSEISSFDAIVHAADRALYTAKRNGRNRVETADYLHAVPNDKSLPASGTASA